MTRTNAAKALASLAWGLVRYAGCVVAYEAKRTDKRLSAEHRWRDECDKRLLAFRMARDEWRKA